MITITATLYCRNKQVLHGYRNPSESRATNAARIALILILHAIAWGRGGGGGGEWGGLHTDTTMYRQEKELVIEEGQDESHDSDDDVQRSGNDHERRGRTKLGRGVRPVGRHRLHHVGSHSHHSCTGTLCVGEG